MAEETGEKPEAEEEEEEEEPEEEVETGGMSSLLSPEGVGMLVLAGMLDLTSAICVILAAAFGIGLILAKIVYGLGLVLISGWIFIRSGTIPVISKKGKAEKQKLVEVAKKQLVDFLKKHSKKLVAKVIPIVGDLIPFWTITVYSELTSKPR